MRVVLSDHPSGADNGPPGRRCRAGTGVSEGWAGRETNRMHEATIGHRRPWTCLLQHEAGLGAMLSGSPSQSWILHSQFKTWRRARPVLHTACRWGTRSSSSRIWYRLPCDHTPAARSRWWRPCRFDTSSHRLPAEPWHRLLEGRTNSFLHSFRKF